MAVGLVRVLIFRIVNANSAAAEIFIGLVIRILCIILCCRIAPRISPLGLELYITSNVERMEKVDTKKQELQYKPTGRRNLGRLSIATKRDPTYIYDCPF